MRRTGRSWPWSLLAASLIVLAPPAALSADEPPRPIVRPEAPAPDAPVNVILNAPGDLSGFLKALARPDFVVLRGDEYAKLIAGSKPATAIIAPWTASVQSVSATGKVEGDVASLSLEFGIQVSADGPVWVPIRLDGQTLTDVAEGSRPLAVKSIEGGGRQVELTGRGAHAVKVDLLVPVRTTPEGRRIELSIPEAPSTRFAIDIPQRVQDAFAAAGEPVDARPGKEPGRTRLAADLTPRSRLGLTWRVNEETTAALPPLLVAQGEIAVEFDPGLMRSQFSCSVRSLRGTARSLELRLDARDELIELELDGQAPSIVSEKRASTTRLSIPLSEPLSPGQELRLIMATRRVIRPDETSRILFGGFPLANAKEQTGAIGVSASGNLWISGTARQGILQIDPRTGLPKGLSARPSTRLAYRFSEQPFELVLRVEPSPPWVAAETRATVSVAPKLARIDTRIDYQTARGKLFDLTLGLPPGLEVDAVGPKDVVATWQVGLLPSGPFPGSLPPGLRLLHVRLAPKAQEEGKFTLQLTAHQALRPGASDVGIALVQPEANTSAGGRLALLTDPSLTAELSEKSSEAPAFRPAAQGPPSDWAWPSGRAPGMPPMLWLRYDDRPAELPLRLTTHARALTDATTLHVHLDRRAADVRQETELAVQFGTLDQVDLTVPAALIGRWQVEGPAIAQKIDLGRTPSGGQALRLKLGTELTRAGRFKFRYQWPMPAEPKVSTPVPLDLPWIKVEGTTGPNPPVRVEIAAGPGLKVSPRGADWSAAPEPQADAKGEVTTRLVGMRSPSSLNLNISAIPLASLPKTVAPRLALRSAIGPGGEARVNARYWIETADGGVSVALPPSAVLQVARAGGETLAAVEQREGGGIRMRFPDPASQPPALVEFDYVIPPEKAASAWIPPRLLDGAVVRQTLWEVSLPWGRAVVGVPRGWTDENQWYWAGYVWQRRPLSSASAIDRWIEGDSAAEPAPTPAGGPGESHVYRFGRPGDPSELPVFIASRAALLATCSGSVLAAGILVVVWWRPPARLVATAALLAAFFAAVLLDPSVLLLAVQSSAVGVVLTALLLFMQRSFDRRRPAPIVHPETTGRNSPPPPGSTMSRAESVGSDDSTAIRPRVPTPSTMDFASAAVAAQPILVMGSSVRAVQPARGEAER